VPSPYGTAVLIVDPSEDRGRVGRALPQIERVLASLDVEHRTVTADGRAGARAAAIGALGDGARFLVAVGGDRTINGVVNGMIVDDHPLNADAVLGVLPAGSGADFPTTFGLPGDVLGAATHLDGDAVFRIDVGKASCVGQDGSPMVRYFPNVAEVGFGADAVARASTMPVALGRRWRAFLGFWTAMARARPAEISVRVGEATFAGEASDVVVANAQYHRGGMRISPRSWPGDGLLDVLVMRGPRSDSFTMLPKIYRGEHLPHPAIEEMKGRTILVDANRRWPVQVDGIPLGVTPARFEVIRGAVALKV
jgi:diacylglycerol kinase family enzyme